ncbi:MAG TPA: hypothetical protein DG753_02470 [Clostridium sp.]|nr:hypothetical protein [Clostridium sp.]
MSNLIFRSNKAEIFTSEEFGQVKTILNEDGRISINAEDAAIGLGWYEEKNGKKYVRWRTFNAYVRSFGVNEEIQKDDYIPESLFYLLAMKAANEAAQNFQRWIAVEIIPEIRRTGEYKSRTSSYSSQSADSDNSEQSNGVYLSPELQAIFCIDRRTMEMNDRVTKIENNTTIDYSQQEEIRQLVNKKVIEVLGGKGTPAYKELSKKVYASIWNDYKRKLNVNSYRNTSVKNYDKAIEMLMNWVPSREIELMITGANVE